MKHLIAAALVLLTACSLLGKKKIQEPKLKLDRVSVGSMGLSESVLNFEVRVTNPNNFPLRLDSVDYDLNFKDQPVGHGRVDKNLEVAAASETVITLPVRVQMNNLLKSLQSLIGDGLTPYHIKGAAKLGLISWPFEERGDLRFANGKVERIKKKD